MEQPITLVQNGPLTIEIHEGQKGDPGKSLRFEDLTPEQIEQLKGPKGDKGDPGSGADVKDVYDMLVSRGYLPNSSSLTDVLNLIVDKANIIDLFIGTELVVRVPVKYGDTTIQIGGINVKGLVIKEKDTENTMTIGQTQQFSYPFTLSHPMDERSVTLEAIWQGQVKSTLVIPGLQANTPVEIASDPAYESIEGPHKIDYREVDNQLWLRQTNSTPRFLSSDVRELSLRFETNRYNTLVLDCTVGAGNQPIAQLGATPNELAVHYQNQQEYIDDIDSNNTLILDITQYSLSFNNLIIVQSGTMDLSSTVHTITVVAPKNMLVGMATKGTTSVPCISVNQGDIVVFDLFDNTVRVAGTNGTIERL